MQTPPIVPPEEWEAARLRLLVKEKEMTKARDAMAAARRRMPWMPVDKAYEFEGPSGSASLLDLFAGRQQLSCTAPSLNPAFTAGPTTLVSAARWSPTKWPTSPI
jgi:predicted dithiol-disulfide oxidoreductase (DUF899 family)